MINLQKQKKLEQKKINIAHNAISKILNMPIEQIIQSQKNDNLILAHFSNGEQQDQLYIEQYFDSIKFEKYHLEMIPGLSFALLKINDLTNTNTLIQFQNRNLIFFYLQQDLNSLQIPQRIPNSIFEIDIPGLFMFQDFIDTQSENELIQFIDQQQWDTIKLRRVQHYGRKFIYGKNGIDPDELQSEIPQIFQNVIKKVQIKIFEQFNKQCNFDQLTINDYQIGGGIPPHIDTHSPFKEFFVSISLISGVEITFQKEQQIRHIYFPKNTLTVFSGEGRYAWNHMIPARKADKVNENIIWRQRRLSLTFRKINLNGCECKWPQYCDQRK